MLERTRASTSFGRSTIFVSPSELALVLVSVFASLHWSKGLLLNDIVKCSEDVEDHNFEQKILVLMRKFSMSKAMFACEVKH